MDYMSPREKSRLARLAQHLFRLRNHDLQEFLRVCEEAQEKGGERWKDVFYAIQNPPVAWGWDE